MSVEWYPEGNVWVSAVLLKTRGGMGGGLCKSAVFHKLPQIALFWEIFWCQSSSSRAEMA